MPEQTPPVIDVDSIIANQQARQRQPQPPNMWAVLLWNDPVTPFGFVIAVLQQVFNHDEGAAQAIMLKAHNDGFAVCAVHPKDVAETKVSNASHQSRSYGYPLQFTAQEA